MDNDTVEDVPPLPIDLEEDDPFMQLEVELEQEPPGQVAELIRGMMTLSQEIKNASWRQQADAKEQC